MKYGVLSYENKYLSLNGRDTQNMGDWFQTIATETLFKQWGVQDYLYISRNVAKYYSGEQVILCYNGFNTQINKINYKTESFPLSNDIIPIFFSMHFHDQYIPDKLKEQFLQFGPVGCRDEETLSNMLNNQIPAYLSGCITALLPKRQENKQLQNTIYFVDVPTDFIKYVPQNIVPQIKYETNLYHINRTYGEPYMTKEESLQSYETAKNKLILYRDTAKLIVTSRLHIASPCMAMGIPVILVAVDFDGRFSWIDKFLPLYAKKDWANIDWNPQPIDYECEKQKIKEILKNQLLFNYKHYLGINSVTQYYKNRTRYEYNSILKTALKNLTDVLGNSCSYAIWGVISNSLSFNNVIKYTNPSWELKHVYDLSVNGYFENLIIEPPEQISKDEDIVYFVLANKAKDSAKKLLSTINKTYILVDFKSDSWEINIKH